MQEILLKIRYFDRGLLTLFFLSNPVLFNGPNYQKQKGSGTSDQSLCRSGNKFKKIPKISVYSLLEFETKQKLILETPTCCFIFSARSEDLLNWC